MNQMPTQPSAYHTLNMSVGLGSGPSIQEILEAYAKIQATYPDALATEVHMLTHDGGWDSDPEIECDLRFYRSVVNPNYEAQMVLYHQALAEYHKAEHDLQMQYNTAYRSRVEQENAKAEWKKARRAERIANRVIPIGMEKCE